MLSPLQAYAPKTRFQSRLSQKRTWSEDMDNHLWMTYMRYLQDPRHTPFKMLPGTAPPLGVCSRVVREAKKTWKGHGAAAASRTQRPTRRTSHRLESLASPMASSAMPVIVEPRKSHVPWPRSDAATRRRLRDLCKRKPSLSAYYTRILRSPSPAPQCAPPVYASLNAEVQPAAPVDVKSSFSTRDMNISLATSTSSTMRLDGILAQLASENEARPIPEQRPIRSFAHQKSQSLHIGLGNGAYPSRALASPFRPLVESRQGGASRFTGHESAQRLEGTPALELFAPAPLRTFKRSAQHDLHDMMSSNEPSGRPGHLVQGIFRSLESGHRRVRSRGFSLGDMSASPRPPAIFNSISSLEQRVEPAPQPAPARLFVLQDDSEAMNRLGSPFSESSMKPRFNTFPRAFSPIAVETTETDQPTAEASVSNQSAAYPFSFI
ncbi:hypothetical protein EJ06DRAFT_520332 [Trichodelitschia bisporula]|uniref:Uncharacterized protein n=1 Tax=Trichodelitschia bisporula TaxID=703511 RepID=A0A6G1I221_9PEZI|nr:hypothetical protein EJ06DRAFT_520332 [Trichodelitschia bisporula]